jgi:type IV secretory pathway VirB2 component (pilin)
MTVNLLPSQAPMSQRNPFALRMKSTYAISWPMRPLVMTACLLHVMPIAAHAQGGSPFDRGFMELQSLFTGTIAKVASLIAVVGGGYGFAYGEPGAKKYQFLWRVHGFDFERQEATLKSLATTFGGDPACTDCNRVLRVPGFYNCKCDPPRSVIVEYLCNSVWNPGDFRLDIPTTNAVVFAPSIASQKPTGKHSNSENDWAWICHALAQGKDAVRLTRDLAARRSDKSNPLYYAQRTIDIASARLWLGEGIRIEDVVTMLETRRLFEIPTALCSARAWEIATTAQRMIMRRKSA